MKAALPIAYLTTKVFARFFPDHGSHCRIATAISAAAPIAMWSRLGALSIFAFTLCLLPRHLLWWPDAPVEFRSKEDFLAWVRTEFLSGASRQWKGNFKK